MALAPGAQLGVYTIGDLIGRGGMGEVYRARDTTLDREVAIKVLPEGFADDQDRFLRFQREAKVLASLNHPHIAHVYGIEVHGGVHGLVMELVEGQTLAEHIARGPIPIDESLPIARQIAAALEAAHDRGVIHRDLKPANVIVRADGMVKVLDFGLAKAVEPSGETGEPAANILNSPTVTSPALTMRGVILGTAAYMAPEQAKGKIVDTRADIWAFGCVFYEMLTGRRAFGGGDVTDTIAAILTKSPDWNALPKGASPHIRWLLRRCLERDRGRRLPHIGIARLEIDDWPVEPPQTRQARGWIAASVATAALLAAIGTISVMWRPKALDADTRQLAILPPDETRFSEGDRTQAISPDGRHIVFQATGAEGSRLWLRSLDASRGRPLVSTEDAFAPFWSPDSQSIAFFSRGKLWRRDLAGGASRALADAVTTGVGAQGGAWGTSGTIVFAPAYNGPLYSIPADGGSPAALTTVDRARRETGHIWPSFLPDGRHFLFTVSAPDAPENSGLYVGSLDGADTKFVSPIAEATAYAPPGHVIFGRDGMLMAQPFDPVRLALAGAPTEIAERVTPLPKDGLNVSAASNGTLVYQPAARTGREFVWVTRRGDRTRVDTPPGSYSGGFALSPDGQRLAFYRTGDVWMLDVTRGIVSRFTTDGDASYPVWSPDGSTIAYANFREGQGDLYQRKSNMSGLQELLLKLGVPGVCIPSDWSADGRYLTFYRRGSAKTQLDLWAMRFGEGSAFPVLQSEANELQGAFSSDGRWLAYVSDESGAPQVYVTSFPQVTGRTQISSTGGLEPRWSRDGKEIFYLAGNGDLMTVSVRVGMTFQADMPQRLFATSLRGTLVSRQYEPSADAQHFVLNVPVETAESALMIVLNWSGLLKR